MAESYKIYRDGFMIAEGITTGSYLDENADTQQIYCYKVVCVSQYMESPSNEICINWSWNTQESTINNGVSIYPSPTQSQITVEALGLTQVVIYNMMGQEVMRENTNGDNLSMDLSSLPQGTYLLKAVTKDSTETQKIIKL